MTTADWCAAAAAAAARLLLSSPLTIFSMESNSLGLFVADDDETAESEAAGDAADERRLLGGDNDDARGGGEEMLALEEDSSFPLGATLSKADPPEDPAEMVGLTADGDDSGYGENLFCCLSLSAAAEAISDDELMLA